MWDYNQILTTMSGLRLPNRGDLVAYFKGSTLEDTAGVSSRDVLPARHGLFSGADHVPLNIPATELNGDLVFELSFNLSTLSGSPFLLGDNGDVGGLGIRIESIGRIQFYRGTASSANVLSLSTGTYQYTTGTTCLLRVAFDKSTGATVATVNGTAHSLGIMANYTEDIVDGLDDLALGRMGSYAGYYCTGAVWSANVNDKYLYSHPVLVDGAAMWYDSGPARNHVTATAVSVSEHCASGISYGSDTYNQKGYRLLRKAPTATNIADNGTDYGNWTIAGAGSSASSTGIVLANDGTSESAKLPVPDIGGGKLWRLKYTVGANTGGVVMRMNSYLTGADATMSSEVGEHYHYFTTTSDITDKTLHFYAFGGISIEYTVDELIEAPNYATNSGAAVLFTFDDGWESQYSMAFAYMSINGVLGTVYVIPTFVDSDGKITTDQCDEMYAAGWALGNHTLNHAYMSAYTKDQAVTEIQGGANWLVDNGYPRAAQHLCYPGGQYNDYVLDAALECECLTSRTITEALQPSNMPNLLELTAVTGGDYYDLNYCKGAIDSAIADGSVCIFKFHRIVETSDDVVDTMDFPKQDFQSLIDYAISADIDILTIDQFYDRLQIHNAYERDTSGPYFQAAQTGSARCCVGNLLTESGRVKYNPTIVSGTGPSDWVIKLPAAPELINILGLDSDYYDASGLPKNITWATHVDNLEVRLGDDDDNPRGVIYSVDQDAASITKIDRIIRNT